MIHSGGSPLLKIEAENSVVKVVLNAPGERAPPFQATKRPHQIKLNIFCSSERTLQPQEVSPESIDVFELQVHHYISLEASLC